MAKWGFICIKCELCIEIHIRKLHIRNVGRRFHPFFKIPHTFYKKLKHNTRVLSKTYCSTPNLTFYLLMITIWSIKAAGVNKIETALFSCFSLLSGCTWVSIIESSLKCDQRKALSLSYEIFPNDWNRVSTSPKNVKVNFVFLNLFLCQNNLYHVSNFYWNFMSAGFKNQIYFDKLILKSDVFAIIVQTLKQKLISKPNGLSVFLLGDIKLALE